MSNVIKFTKMQGLGNDYVYINGFASHVTDPGALSKRVSDRHFGIGSDGLVLILPSNKADVRMRMFNPDGSEAEMCGNAIRCVGKFVFDNGLCTKDTIRVETAAGIRIVRLLKDGGCVTGATVDMGAPVLAPADIPAILPEGVDKPQFVDCPVTVDGTVYQVTAVSMGNPHAVFFVSSVERFPLEEAAHILQHHPAFPESVNVGVVERFTAQEARIRVFERGAGETPACGTGTCAAFAVGRRLGLFDECVRFEARGGSLACRESKDGCVLLSGPAQFIAEGRFYWNVENV